MRNSPGVPHSTERCKITKYSASPQAICHFLTLFYCPRRYICSDWPVQFQNVLSFRVLKRICHPRSRDATPARLPSVLPFTRRHSGASPRRKSQMGMPSTNDNVSGRRAGCQRWLQRGGKLLGILAKGCCPLSYTMCGMK